MEFGVTFLETEYERLQNLLFPGDGREAVAFAVCGISRGPDRSRLLVREVLKLPTTSYLERVHDQVKWKTTEIIAWLDRLEKEQLCFLKCHSHPGGLAEFSKLDDISDSRLLKACYEWNPDGLHASLVLTENAASARIVTADGQFQEITSIRVIGKRLHSLHKNPVVHSSPEQLRLVQAFGEGTYGTLRQLRVAVIGASGTGSLMIESLVRTGVGELVLVDPELVETVNLNRVLHATQDDVQQRTPKTSVAARNIRSIGLGTRVKEIQGILQDPHVVRMIAGCDLIMGCVDNREARQFLSRISAFYLVPYIDAGVAIHAAKDGMIENISAAVHYIQPGQSFIARGVFDSNALREEALRRTDPEHYKEQMAIGYITGVNVNRPAVMPLNMIASGFAVMELLARIHGFRNQEEGEGSSETFISVDIGFLQQRADRSVCPSMRQHLGRGDTTPLLGMPALTIPEKAA